MYIKYFVSKVNGDRMCEDVFEKIFASAFAQVSGDVHDVGALKDLIVVEADKLGYDYVKSMDVIAETSIAFNLLSHVASLRGA